MIKKMFAILDKAKPDIESLKRLKLGGGQAHERSSDYNAVVAEVTGNMV
jgi:hypothetical protein